MNKYRGYTIKRQKQTSERTPIIIPELKRCASNIKDAKRIIDLYISGVG